MATAREIVERHLRWKDRPELAQATAIGFTSSAGGNAEQPCYEDWGVERLPGVSASCSPSKNSPA